MASVRKIYVDSRFGRGPAHRFTYELPETVTCNEGCVAYITGFSCPISFLTVTQGVNDKLYWLEAAVNEALPLLAVHGRIMTLQPAVYNATSLAMELQRVLNLPDKTLTQATYSCSYEAGQNHLLITATPADPSDPHFFAPVGDFPLTDRGFHDFTWPALTQYDASLNYDYTNPTTANSLLGITTNVQPGGGGLEPVFAGSYQTTTVDVRTVSAIYLHSENLGVYNTIGPNGTHSIIHRIPIRDAYGSVIHDQHSGLIDDVVDCSQQSFRTLQFSIRDACGNLVDLQGGYVTFSILFAQGR